MSDNELQELINEMIEEGDAYTYVEYMRKENLKSSEAAKVAFEHGMLHPNTSVIYKYASNDIRDAIIKELNKEELDETVSANNLLMALAQIGDDVVCEAFKKWEEHPPKWREELYIGPAGYAKEGGWCIENGKKKMLTYNRCYSLHKTDNPVEADIVMGGVSSKQKCPYCESGYSNLLVLDGKDERLSDFGIKGKIKIKYCIFCGPYEPFIFTKYEVDGEGEVIDRTEGYFAEDDVDLDELTYFKLSQEPVSDIYCDEFERSAIGGFPAFISDAEYADCPICKKKMKHFAQLSDHETGANGTIYVQICTDCETAAVHYQAT